MRIFNTYLYEVSKGTKPVALITCDDFLRERIVKKLEKEKMHFVLQDVCEGKTNIFFGVKECIQVIKKIAVKPLNELSIEEDFILGTILGYDVRLQCRRFLEKSA